MEGKIYSAQEANSENALKEFREWLTEMVEKVEAPDWYHARAILRELEITMDKNGVKRDEGI